MGEKDPLSSTASIDDKDFNKVQSKVQEQEHHRDLLLELCKEFSQCNEVEKFLKVKLNLLSKDFKSYQKRLKQ